MTHATAADVKVTVANMTHATAADAKVMYILSMTITIITTCVSYENLNFVILQQLSKYKYQKVH
ncbi:hypothetical protein [Candidatus Epulonipiscium viviparus]|uniref:hypothetical protein n=1 Tax=Candidatus Epulonipiscium viviparus TaxID=420336 RepID=UPI00016C0F19|nr:hypothetical protein [Candidatus Epulopiscium viviparus]